MNKLVDEAPFHPGYEDAVVNPTPKYIGLDPAKMIWKPKPMTEEDLDRILDSLDTYIDTHAGVVRFLRAIEAHHGIK